ncbi:serine/threonine-protein kinase, partial [Catenulispora rubra]|uniref:serine/threonine-protein kinase n=1 Tax=Catenulispora rubra TaxID=280293 RepID=UPI0018927193
MEANRPAPGPGGYGGLGAGSIVSKNIQPLLEADPRQIGPYTVRGRLGQGAMGSVYLGFAPTGQAFALKVLRQDFAADRDFRKRFAREIAAARAVHSPFVNAVTDADPNAATPWLASYFIPGPPLSAAVQLAGPFSPRSVAHLGVGIGLALQAIHTAGIVHRDLKPANVLVASDGPRVIDFGIARATDASMLTATGMRLGTPSFMAPEQVAGADVDAPADVWAVGGMLIYAATGRTPFGLGDAMAILYRVEHHEPDLEGLEPALAYIATRCLAKDAVARPTPTQLVEMCRAALDGGIEGRPALRGSDVTGWLPSAVSRDLAARAVELANMGQMLPGPGPAPAPLASPTAGAGDTGLSTGAGGRTGGGLGGFLRRKGGGQATSAGSATGAAYSGQPIGQYSGQYSQGTAMSGGQGQYGQPGGQTDGGQYGPPPGQGQGQPQGAAGQEEQDPNGAGGQQHGAPPPQGYGPAGAGAQQPAPPAWGPSGPSGSDMPTIITPPPAAVPAPEPQEPAWRAATSSHAPAPEPDSAGLAGLPAGFTPIGEEAKQLAEAAEAADSIAAATNVPDENASFGQQSASEGSAFGQPVAESGAGSSFGQPPSAASSSESGSAPESSPEPAPESAASDVDAAFGPPKPADPGVPQIAEPTFATNFNIPAVTPQSEAGSAPVPAAKPSVGVPQIAEPTFATNFNIPVVTATSGTAESDESEGGAPAPKSSGVTVPQIAEPTFATNFNIPVVTATDPNADGNAAPAARTGPPQVSVPSIAEPGWATGFGIPAVTPEAPPQDADEDAAPKPVTHAPPIPPHLQQPMTPPPGFGGPATAANRQQPPAAQDLQQTQQQQVQQPFAPSQPSTPSSPFAQTQIQSPQQAFGSAPQGQQAFGSAPQAPFAPPQSQQGFGSAPQQGQQPFGSAPQAPFAPPQGQPAQQPYAAQQPPQGYQQQPQPGYQQPPAQGYQQAPQGFQQQGFQQPSPPQQPVSYTLR